jgi:hypothetical protein
VKPRRTPVLARQRGFEIERNRLHPHDSLFAVISTTTAANIGAVCVIKNDVSEKLRTHLLACALAVALIVELLHSEKADGEALALGNADDAHHNRTQGRLPNRHSMPAKEGEIVNTVRVLANTLRSATLTASCIALMSIACAAPANAQAGYESIGSFQTPSGNIHCEAAFNGNRSAAELRCDMKNRAGRTPAKPKDCELDYGDSFGLSEPGAAERLCAGDTIMSPGFPVLAYGAVWNESGLRCDVTRRRLRCVNRRGRGFTLSTTRQQLL